MSSIIDLSQENIDEVPEPEAVEDGEYELLITEVRQGTDKNGNPYMMPFFEIKDAPNAKEVSKYIPLLHDEMNEKDRNKTLRGIKYFGQAFGIDFTSPIDLESDLPGLEGWAILGKKYDEEYGEQNTIKRFVTPG